MAILRGIRGIRQTIPSGFAIGRSSPGSSKGQPGLVPLPPSTQQAIISSASGKPTQTGGIMSAGTISGVSAATTVLGGTGITVTGSIPTFTVVLQTPVTVANGGTGTASAGQLPATATNDSASAGKMGEYISSTILSGSAISITNNVLFNLTTISLTAGDWDIYGNITFSPSSSIVSSKAALNTTSVTLPDIAFTNFTGPNGGAGLTFSNVVPSQRVSLATTTTIYLVGLANFSAGTSTACGLLWARRAR